MKMTPPWSREPCTQPASVTCLPMSVLRNELQLCVRYIAPVMLSEVEAPLKLSLLVGTDPRARSSNKSARRARSRPTAAIPIRCDQQGLYLKQAAAHRSPCPSFSPEAIRRQTKWQVARRVARRFEIVWGLSRLSVRNRRGSRNLEVAGFA